MRSILLALAVLGCAAADAPAPKPEPKPALQLCATCADKAFTADIGTCAACGAGTASGAFTRCTVCAQKQGVCQACGAKVKDEAKKP